MKFMNKKKRDSAVTSYTRVNNAVILKFIIKKNLSKIYKLKTGWTTSTIIIFKQKL